MKRSPVAHDYKHNFGDAEQLLNDSLFVALGAELCNAVQVVKRSTAAHERYDFGDAGRLLYDFFWGEFADWYIEAAKARLYGEDQQAAAQTRQVSFTAVHTCQTLSC